MGELTPADGVVHGRVSAVKKQSDRSMSRWTDFQPETADSVTFLADSGIARAPGRARDVRDALSEVRADRLVPVVAVPARNEEALLPRLLAALARQTVIVRLDAPLAVVIVLNNTTDGSQGVIAEAAATFPQLEIEVVTVAFPPTQAHVGSARSLAMARAALRAPEGVILTTDADAEPTDTWVEANLRAIGAGADIVGGRILGDPQEEAQLGPAFLRRASLHGRYAALCDELAALVDPLDDDPWPRHHDHTGGSLSVRASVYDAVGGLDPLPMREDVGFVSKVRAAGFRLRHPLDVVVTVSARTQGRATGGMADCLSRWMREETEGAPVRVESPLAVERRLLRRRAIRQTGQMSSEQARLALNALGIPSDELAGIPALIERHAADDLDAAATDLATEAIAALESRIGLLREEFDAA